MNDPLYDVTLTGFAYGGDAFGRIPDSATGDRVVFVPFALPGERVRIRLVEQRRGWARGELVQVLEPSAERVTPRCVHFGACGGCHYQHMPYDMQLKAKTDILRDQFRRIGRIDDPPVHDAIASPDPWNYRNQVQFHLAPDGRVGYVRAGWIDDRVQDRSGHRAARTRRPAVLPISECHLPEPALNSLWPQLEFEPDIDIHRVSIRQGAGEELMVVLESDTPSLPELEIDSPVAIVHTYEEHSVVLAGTNHIRIDVQGRNFQVSAPSFFQVNTAMAAQMVSHVLNILASLPNLPIYLSTDLALCQSTILDVYCGVGLFSAFLAPMCKRLVGIESSPSACEDFAVNLDEFSNIELYEDAAENVLPALDAQPDIILADPPRAGLEPAARDAVVHLNPKTIIYVSCDPSTLARDARRFIDAGYHLESVTPFDLFPQTYHIESISWFQR